jgi:hypothetical protein
MQLLGAMAPPGGGRNAFSQRISACFSMVNMTQPNDAQLRRIFSTLINSKLAEFSDEVRPLGDPMVVASVEIYRAVCRELLPTPSKSHYLFNTRDLAKIVLGAMQVCRCQKCIISMTKDDRMLSIQAGLYLWQHFSWCPFMSAMLQQLGLRYLLHCHYSCMWRLLIAAP